jgi:hypothetical protein
MWSAHRVCCISIHHSILYFPSLQHTSTLFFRSGLHVSHDDICSAACCFQPWFDVSVISSFNSTDVWKNRVEIVGLFFGLWVLSSEFISAMSPLEFWDRSRICENFRELKLVYEVWNNFANLQNSLLAVQWETVESRTNSFMDIAEKRFTSPILIVYITFPCDLSLWPIPVTHPCDPSMTCLPLIQPMPCNWATAGLLYIAWELHGGERFSAALHSACYSASLKRIPVTHPWDPSL